MQPNAPGAVMRRRRMFLTRMPFIAGGLAAACRGQGSAADSSAPPPAASAAASAPAGAGRPAPLLRELPAAAPTLRWTPEHRDLVYTFGGAAPKHRIAPGTRIVTWTEDCFDGLVKTASDLPSKAMPP